jgi:hypothetical protein
MKSILRYCVLGAVGLVALFVAARRKLPRQVDSCEVEFNAASKCSW